MSIDNATPQEWDKAVRARCIFNHRTTYHYKDKGIQPLEYAYSNGLTPNLTNVVKYVTRNKTDRVKDLLKARHYIELELEMVYGVDPEGNSYD